MTQEEFDEMLLTSLKNNLRVECSNNGSRINFRLYWGRIEIKSDSCESVCR
jgi:hypothetical protein